MVIYKSLGRDGFNFNFIKRLWKFIEGSHMQGAK